MNFVQKCKTMNIFSFPPVYLSFSHSVYFYWVATLCQVLLNTWIRAVNKKEKSLSSWSLYSSCRDFNINLIFNIIVSFYSYFFLGYLQISIFCNYTKFLFKLNILILKLSLIEVYKIINNPGNNFICKNYENITWMTNIWPHSWHPSMNPEII